MKNILSPAYEPLLDSWKSTGFLLALDYDGTLTPITDKPIEARLAPSTKRLLQKLSCKYPCAVVSGRRLKDLRELLRGTEIRYLIGNHGMQWSRGFHLPDDARRKVAIWKKSLNASLRGNPGIQIEDKGLTLSIHYRQSAHPKRALKKVLDAASHLKGARVIGGKFVVNLTPKGVPHKGDALVRLKGILRVKRVLFIGDDITDEDAFSSSLPKCEFLPVRVGRSRKSSARYFVSDQSRVSQLLERFI